MSRGVGQVHEISADTRLYRMPRYAANATNLLKYFRSLRSPRAQAEQVPASNVNGGIGCPTLTGPQARPLPPERHRGGGTIALAGKRCLSYCTDANARAMQTIPKKKKPLRFSLEEPPS